MKLPSILVLLAICAPLTAHAQTDNAQSADVPDVAALPPAPASAATSDALVWRFMPPVGSRWTMRSFVRSTSNTQTPAMNGEKAHSMKFAFIQKMTADYDILSRDALGATTIRMTVREMTNNMNAVIDGKTTKSPPSKNAKSANGATLTLKQAPDGKVWGVSGLRAFQRKLLEADGNLDAATITQILDANPMTSDTGMIKSLSGIAGTLPASPIRVSESWNYDVTLPAQMPLALQITGTRTLKSLNSDVAVIADSATLDGGANVQKLPNMPGAENIEINFSQLTGALSGTSRVQRSSGLPLEATTNMTLRGSISMKTPASANAQTLKVPLDVTSSARIVLEPR